MAGPVSLHEIKRTSLLDVPQRLRELADELQKRPELCKTAIVVVTYPEGRVCVRAYGERTTGLETTGWLARALQMMTDGSGVQDNFTWHPPQNTG